MDESYRLKIEYVPLDQLKPYERNARKHGDTDIDANKIPKMAFI